MALFSIECATCRAKLKVRQMAAIGQILECPKCGSMVMVTPPAGWQPPPQEPAQQASRTSAGNDRRQKSGSSQASKSSIQRSRTTEKSTEQTPPAKTPQAKEQTPGKPSSSHTPHPGSSSVTKAEPTQPARTKRRSDSSSSNSSSSTSSTASRPLHASDPVGLDPDDDTIVESTESSPLALAATASAGLDLSAGKPDVSHADTALDPEWTSAPRDDLEDALAAPSLAVSPAELMWKRVLLWGSGATAALLVVVAIAWSLLSSSGTVEPPETPVAENTDPAAPATPEHEDPPAETVVEQTEDAAPAAPWQLRWTPQEAKAALSLSLAKPAAAGALQTWLEQPQLAGTDTLNQCLVAFELEVPQLRNLAWSTVAIDDWQSGVIAIRLHEPIADPDAIIGTAEKLEMQLGDGPCYQKSADLWPHPFALIDDHTLVTGPLELLSELAAGTPQRWSSWAFSQLATVQQPQVTPVRLVLDTAAARDTGLDLPPAWIEAWPAAAESWDVIRSLVDGVVFESDVSEPYPSRLGLLCAGNDSAEEVGRLSEQLIGQTHQDTTTLLDMWPADADGTGNAEDAGPSAKVVLERTQSLLDRMKLRVDGSLVWIEAPLQLPPTELASGSVDWLRRWDAQRLAAEDQPAEPPQPDEPDMPEVKPEQGPAPLASQRLPIPPVDVKARLEDSLLALEFPAGRLLDFLRLVETLSGIPIDVDPAGLARAGESLDTQLAVSSGETTVAGLLNEALQPHGLGYVVGSRTLLITSADQLAQIMRYPVSDLLDRTTTAALAETARKLSGVGREKDSGTLSAEGGSLVVEGTPAQQGAVLEFLERLRVARGQQPLTAKAAPALTATSRRAAAASKRAEAVNMNFFTPAPLADVASFLEGNHEIFVLLDHAALAQDRVNGQTPLKLTVSEVPLQDVLQQIADRLELDFAWLNDRTVLLTTRSRLAQRPELAWYRVGPALVADAGGQQLLADLQENVLPGTWQSEGKEGIGTAWVDPVSQSLFVRHHQAAQREVEKWLKARMPAAR